MPLDEVVFYDTGMEFDAIYNNRDKLLPILKQNKVKYTELKPTNEFMYDMLYRQKTKRNGDIVYGDGWCGGGCRWGTYKKINAINKFCKDSIVYIGLAADEQSRLAKLDSNKVSPIANAGMTEQDCLKYCTERGFNWIEFSPVTQNSKIDLYDILDRVSCWCCRNKNQRELHNIWYYLPQYWAKLKEIEKKIGQPMKNYHTKQDGFYGDLGSMEKVFEKRHKSTV